MRLTIGILLISILVFVSTTNAKVYKWTDENGKTHYSDKPVNDKSEVIKVNKERSGKSVEDAKRRSAKRMESYRRISEAAESERQVKRNLVTEAEKKQVQIQKECTEAKRQILVYSGRGTLYTRDDSGKRNYFGLSDEKKNAKLAELEKMIKEKC